MRKSFKMFALLFVSLCLLFVSCASVEETSTTSILSYDEKLTPYRTDFALAMMESKKPIDIVSIGKHYKGYRLSGGDHMYFDLEGKYSFFTFTVGPVDSVYYGDQVLTLRFILDGSQIGSYRVGMNSLEKDERISIPVGSRQLRVEVEGSEELSLMLADLLFSYIEIVEEEIVE